MGFAEEEVIVNVAFEEGHRFHGFEVKVRGDAPAETMARFERINDETEPVKAWETIRHFGDTMLVSWNYERPAGNPIPATGEGMMQCSYALVMDLLKEIMAAVREAPAPLEQPSRNGSDPLPIHAKAKRA